MEAFGGYLVDEKAVRVENAFLDFLKRFDIPLHLLVFIFVIINLISLIIVSFLFWINSFRSGQRNELYYESEIEVMRANESNTMFIDFEHVIRFSDVLQKAISDEYLRYYYFLI